MRSVSCYVEPRSSVNVVVNRLRDNEPPIHLAARVRLILQVSLSLQRQSSPHTTIHHPPPPPPVFRVSSHTAYHNPFALLSRHMTPAAFSCSRNTASMTVESVNGVGLVRSPRAALIRLLLVAAMSIGLLCSAFSPLRGISATPLPPPQPQLLNDAAAAVGFIQETLVLVVEHDSIVLGSAQPVAMLNAEGGSTSVLSWDEMSGSYQSAAIHTAGSIVTGSVYQLLHITLTYQKPQQAAATAAAEAAVAGELAVGRIICGLDQSFMVLGRGWMSARYLRPNDSLLAHDKHVTVVVERIALEQPLPGTAAVSLHSFEVPVYHSFFVQPVDVQTRSVLPVGVLAHNPLHNYFNQHGAGRDFDRTVQLSRLAGLISYGLGPGALYVPFLLELQENQGNGGNTITVTAPAGYKIHSDTKKPKIDNIIADAAARFQDPLGEIGQMIRGGATINIPRNTAPEYEGAIQNPLPEQQRVRVAGKDSERAMRYAHGGPNAVIDQDTWLGSNITPCSATDIGREAHFNCQDQMEEYAGGNNGPHHLHMNALSKYESLH